MTNLALQYIQYFLLVFCVACGLLQAVCASRKIRGLQLFQSQRLSYGFAAVFSIAPFVVFYAAADRNLLPVIEGAQQSGLYVAGISAATAATAAVTSLVNARKFNRAASQPGEGLCCLRDMTWWRYLRASMSRRHGGSE